MGKGHVHEGGGSLTEASFEHLAKEWGMSLEATKNEVHRMLGRSLEEKKT